MGNLTNTAQTTPTWGDLSARVQDALELRMGRAWVMVTTLNHTTRGQEMFGFWPTTTLDDEPNCALHTKSNFLRARFGANTGGREVPYSAATDYPVAVVWTETGYKVYSKRGDDWYMDWHVRQSDVLNYAGLSIYDAVGDRSDRLIVKDRPARLFAFDVDIDAPQLGDGSVDDGGQAQLMPYEWYMEFDYVAEPSAGYIEINYGFYEDISVSPTVQAWYTIRIDSSSLLEVGLTYDGTFYVSNYYPDLAPTITPGSTIRIMTDYDGIRIFENDTLVFTYDYSPNYDVGPDYARNRDWALASLGTDGEITYLKIGKRRLRDESGLGSDIVTNGAFAADTNWTKDTEWTISGGEAHVVGDGAGIAEMYESGATGFVNGKLYQGSFDIPLATTIGPGVESVSLMNCRIADVVNASQMAYAYEVGSFAGRMWSRNTPKIAFHNGKDISADIDNVVVQEVLFSSDELGNILSSMLT